MADPPPPVERDPPAIGQAIRALRKRSGMSQRELARQCGRHNVWLSRKETGERRVSPADRMEIADALGVELAELEILAADIDRQSRRAGRAQSPPPDWELLEGIIPSRIADLYHAQLHRMPGGADERTLLTAALALIASLEPEACRRLYTAVHAHLLTPETMPTSGLVSMLAGLLGAQAPPGRARAAPLQSTAPPQAQTQAQPPQVIDLRHRILHELQHDPEAERIGDEGVVDPDWLHRFILRALGAPVGSETADPTTTAPSPAAPGERVDERGDNPMILNLHMPPEQHGDYTSQIIKTFEVKSDPGDQDDQRAAGGEPEQGGAEESPRPGGSSAG